jgi:hypothetical protein
VASKPKIGRKMRATPVAKNMGLQPLKFVSAIRIFLIMNLNKM